MTGSAYSAPLAPPPDAPAPPPLVAPTPAESDAEIAATIAPKSLLWPGMAWNPHGQRRAALDRELCVIDEQGLTNYFQIVYDLVRFVRSRNILCQGRGSAANSLISYPLDSTPIDRGSIGVVF